MTQEQLKFPGFPEKPVENYWQYPKIMNGFWHALTPIEQKVLDYILRHTWGWQKNSDYISYSQLKNGIPNCDKGTGIKSDRTISKALKGLTDKNMIKRISGKEKGTTNYYSLVLEEGRQEVKRGSAKSKEGGLARSKDTINKNTINNNNKDIATLQVGERKDKDIFELIELFKPINPSYELFFKRTNQRDALARLIKKIGRDSVEVAIMYAEKTNTMPYAPTITTPIQ